MHFHNDNMLIHPPLHETRGNKCPSYSAALNLKIVEKWGLLDLHLKDHLGASVDIFTQSHITILVSLVIIINNDISPLVC